MGKGKRGIGNWRKIEDRKERRSPMLGPLLTES